MEVKIGVQNAPRELVVEVPGTAADVEAALGQALAGLGPLRLTDTKGRTLIVPSDRIAYIEIGASTAGQVGFRS
ncbi:MAG: DUF3107 domain-containing protein [Nocardioides sp.]